jgi:cyclopropane-fatty-acyl-phospholipid synthase
MIGVIDYKIEEEVKMASAESIIRELLAPTGVEINGSKPWDIQVHQPALFDRVLRDATLGLGEAYVEGWWDCQAIDQFITRVLLAQLDERIKNESRFLLQALKARLFNRQSRNRAFEVGIKHYDLGNDLYTAMLDKRMAYTCGYWKTATNLDEAQEAKMDLVCRKIGAHPGMRILELGCGWGSFAKYAAEKYGVEVLGVTVSKEQVALGMEMCRGLPVELRLQDYREVSGTYDAVVSIGVMEHVGYKNYRTYMQVVDRCLKPDGVAFVHTIGSNKTLTHGEPWTDKYIFPNGMLPSLSALSKSMEGLFVVEDLHNFGPDYDPTLMAWVANFEAAWPDLKSKYGDAFYRMWRYYLLTSAGGFRARNQQLWQIVFTRQGTPQPDCRKS